MEITTPLEHTPDKSSVGFAVEGIAVGEGLARFGGREDRYKRALLRFANDTLVYEPPEVSEEFRRYVHSLRGVSANLGINGIAQLASIVEQDVIKGWINEAAYARLTDALNAVSERILALVPAQEADNKAVKSGTREQYEENLKALKEAIYRASPGNSEPILKTLAGTEWQNVEAPDFSYVQKAVDEYDFGRALKLLEKIMDEQKY